MLNFFCFFITFRNTFDDTLVFIGVYTTLRRGYKKFFFVHRDTKKKFLTESLRQQFVLQCQHYRINVFLLKQSLFAFPGAFTFSANIHLKSFHCSQTNFTYLLICRCKQQGFFFPQIDEWECFIKEDSVCWWWWNQTTISLQHMIFSSMGVICHK